jgi:hypothetical protein
MNPLFTFTKYAGRAFTTLVATGTLIFAAGCGGGGSNFGGGGGGGNGGFTAGSLKGQYVISQTGIGVNQALTSADPFSETIVFTADGNKNLNVTVDDFNQDGTPFILAAPVAGAYSIGSNGTGFISFNGSTYAITMIDDSHFSVIEWDTFATASGSGEKQDTTAFAAAPSGSFVFKAHNIDTSSRVGGVTITAGAIAGNEDLLNLGFLSSSHAVASSVSMNTPDANGRGAFTLSDGTAFNYYVVNSGKFHIMSNLGSLEIGQAEAQTGGPFSLATLAANTSYVFGSSGDTSFPLGIHSAGVFTTDGGGNIVAGSGTVPGAVDFVQDATVNSNLPVSGGTYTLAASGRGQINMTLSGGAISPQIFWMVSGTRAYFLANSAAAVEDGTFSLQQGAPFTALSSQATFIMDGFDTTYKDRVGVFTPTASTFTWNQASDAFDATQILGAPSTLSTNGNYQVSSNGRVAATVNGVTSGVVFYLSSPNTGFMVQEDADVGGSFALQASQ